jgi:hypothetical protein
MLIFTCDGTPLPDLPRYCSIADANSWPNGSVDPAVLALVAGSVTVKSVDEFVDVALLVEVIMV